MGSSRPSRKPPAGCAGCSARRRRSRFSSLPSLRASDEHVEAGTDPNFRPNRQLPAMRVDDFAHVAETKPGAIWPRGEEWREQLLKILFVHSLSCILDAESAFSQDQANFASGTAGLQRVEDEV